MDKSSNSWSPPPLPAADDGNNQSAVADSNNTTTAAAAAAAENNNNSTTTTDHYLKHLNKLSHKITKQPRKLSDTQTTSSPPQPQPQPPVYSINKNDFRHVVQKLTGSPAHHPIQPPKNTSSRLQKIRPPPLPAAELRQQLHQPLSPLPPFPSVHTAAESPISAYMRSIQGSASSTTDLNNVRLEDWKRFAPLPSSPLGGFGCLPSPKALFSPTTLGFPHSSPRWKGV